MHLRVCTALAKPADHRPVLSRPVFNSLDRVLWIGRNMRLTRYQNKIRWVPSKRLKPSRAIPQAIHRLVIVQLVFVVHT